MRLFFVILLLVPIVVFAQGPNGSVRSAEVQNSEVDSIKAPVFSIKTNLLYDVTATFNLGVEFRIGRNTSIEMPVNYNPWTFKDNRKWKHVLVQPEFRLWTRETFVGHFFGLHAHYAFYNVGNLPHGPFSENMRDHRFEGWALGAGLSYGHRWNFGDNWAMEATLGLGYAYLDYDKYKCETCGEKLAGGTKHYFGPTKLGVNLIYSFNKKKPATSKHASDKVSTVLEKQEKDAMSYEPQFTVIYVTPDVVESVRQRSESGKAYLDFNANSSEIIYYYKNNSSELQKLDAMIKSIKDNPSATITKVTITGYASPEGTAYKNRSMSKLRAQALRERMVSVNGLSNSLFTVNGAGEDWEGLDSLLNFCPLSEKNQMQEIVRNIGVNEGRERKLMLLAKGGPYRWMKANLFPKLRRVEYRIDYTVPPFTVEQGRSIMFTSPESLSIYELFLIAKSYSPGSDECNYAFEIAARLYPDSDVANLNAAASALDRKDTVSAARYLSRIKTHDTAYWNNSGILAFMQGDTEKAAECFAKAQSFMDNIIFKNSVELDRHERSK